MKNRSITPFLILMLFTSTWALGGKKTSTTKQNAAPQDNFRQGPKPNVKSDHSFDQSVVQGKYQISNEGLAVVEEEKNLDDLLGMRFEFKDRLRKQTR